jgi:two-component system cell cycle sensor histidine kinase/response regulator CckA
VTTDHPQDSSLAGAHTILVIDDVGVVRKAAFHLLSEAGYRVFEAASAAEAMEVLGTSRQAIDLAIVDVVMPGVGGVELVRAIREEWPTVRVLYMSAHPAEVLVREGLHHPRVFFLAKPFTRSELMEKVEAAVSSTPAHDGESSRTPRTST